MSSERPPENILGLPMFQHDNDATSGSPTRGGRVRSSFTYGSPGLPQAPSPISPSPAPAVPPPPPARLQAVPPSGGLPEVVGIPLVRASEVSRGGGGVDWGVVAYFRQIVAERLAERQSESQLTDDNEESEGWAIIRQVLDEDDSDQIASRAVARSDLDRAALSQAIFDAVFRLGRLQPLVDDSTIENIVITGCDNVMVERSDGVLEWVDPVADSDDELTQFLEYLAGRADNPRTFTPSHPSLHMTLPGGARLAAARDTARISVVIRRHRVKDVRLDDLVGWGSLTPALANFMSAAVKAGLNIVVSGDQGAGKTTFLRALCAEIDPMEMLGTFETEYELFLHEMPDRHPIVHAWEERGGSGEEGMGGRSAGARTTAEQIIDSFRFRLDRQILGEIRGPEVWSMVKLMESGAGSMSTTHAASASSAVDKLVSCAMEAGPHISHDVAIRKLARTIDLVVQLGCDVVRDRRDTKKARKVRYVDEVVLIQPGEAEVGYSASPIFGRRPGRCAVAQSNPDTLTEMLATHGWDERMFASEMMSNGRLGAV